MPTTRPVPERTFKVQLWTINELENDHGIEFISPNNYVFGFANIKALLDWIADISWPGMQHGTMYGDVHEVDGARIIRAWTPDPWINSDWKHLDQIVQVGEFIDIAVAYIYEQWIR